MNGSSWDMVHVPHLFHTPHAGAVVAGAACSSADLTAERAADGGDASIITMDPTCGNGVLASFTELDFNRDSTVTPYLLAIESHDSFCSTLWNPLTTLAVAFSCGDCFCGEPFFDSVFFDSSSPSALGGDGGGDGRRDGRGDGRGDGREEKGSGDGRGTGRAEKLVAFSRSSSAVFDVFIKSLLLFTVLFKSAMVVVFVVDAGASDDPWPVGCTARPPVPDEF